VSAGQEDSVSALADLSPLDYRHHDDMPKQINVDFGNRLRQLRRKQGWTQRYMSMHVGLDLSYISDMENGKKAICLPTLQDLSLAFGISISQILSGL
jgi:ribosome-binding protein aMBF1 (putative translation factor)